MTEIGHPVSATKVNKSMPIGVTKSGLPLFVREKLSMAVTIRGREATGGKREGLTPSMPATQRICCPDACLPADRGLLLSDNLCTD